MHFLFCSEQKSFYCTNHIKHNYLPGTFNGRSDIRKNEGFWGENVFFVAELYKITYILDPLGPVSFLRASSREDKSYYPTYKFSITRCKVFI